MKTILPFLLMFLALCNATAQIVNIPDPVFKQALLDHGFNTGIEIDTNFDGEIQVSEAEALTGLLDVNGQFIDIHDLTGIEAFVNITELNVFENQLTSLDLTSNTELKILNCFFNPLTNLNISQCSSLEELHSENTELTFLDITNNSLLTLLNVSQSQITSLDLTQNPNLWLIGVSDNQLIFLDIRNGNSNNITVFGAHGNPDLICIFVDDAEYFETNFAGNIDPQSAFVETQAECDALAVIDFPMDRINIYPNPVKDLLQIKSNSGYKMQGSELSLTDVLGRIIYQTTITALALEIDMSQLKGGIYFIVLKNKGQLLTKKLIKL